MNACFLVNVVVWTYIDPVSYNYSRLNREQVKKIVNPYCLVIHLCSDCNGFLQMKDVTHKVNETAAATATANEAEVNALVDQDIEDGAESKEKDKNEKDKNTNKKKNKQTTKTTPSH